MTVSRLALFTLLVPFGSVTLAQATTFLVSGEVRDASNSIVGAEVIISRLDTTHGDSQSETVVRRNQFGHYEAVLQYPGRYVIQVHAQHYCSWQSRPFQVSDSLTFDIPTLVEPNGQGCRTDVTPDPAASTFSVEATARSSGYQIPSTAGSNESIATEETENIPFSAPQEYRNALKLLPGVIEDSSQQLHFYGGDSNQTDFRLDGFRISDPQTGYLQARLNIDAVQEMQVTAADPDVTRGRGTAASTDINTVAGSFKPDFLATDFIPDLTTQGGFQVKSWSPRALFITLFGADCNPSGWFENATSTYYKLNIVSGLPSGENTGTSLAGCGKMGLRLRRVLFSQCSFQRSGEEPHDEVGLQFEALLM